MDVQQLPGLVKIWIQKAYADIRSNNNKKIKLNDATARNLDVVCTIGYNPL